MNLAKTGRGDGQAQDPSEIRHTVPAQGRNRVDITVNLRNIPLLSQLGDEEMKLVKDGLRFRLYDKRVTVLQKGASGGGLFFLLTGQIHLVDITEDGRAISLRMLSQGDFFGEISLINGAPYSASAVTLSQVLVGILPAQTALHLFSHCPAVAHFLLRHLAQQVQRDAEFRALLSINNTFRRILNFLLLIKREQPGNLHVVENLPTHQDIANMINTSRETVTRVLLTLAQQGLIQKDAHRLIIVDPAAMQKLAQNA